MTQPEGFVHPANSKKVCKLERSIYGLKEASRSWNLCFDKKIQEIGFLKSKDEQCVYIRASGSTRTFLVLYGDDILLIGNDVTALQEVKSWLGSSFAIKDLGEASYILGIKIHRDRSRRLIGPSQSAYIEKVLKRFNMKDSKKVFVPLTHSKC